MEGSESDVSAFMLFATSVSSPGGEPSMKEETIEVDILGVTDILRLARRRNRTSTEM